MSTIKKTFIPFIFNALLFSFTKNANAELSKDEWFEINKTNAIINPETGKELEARVTYFSKNKDSFNAKDAGAYIDKQKKLFKEIKDKTSPHYNPGKESTYAKDLIVGSVKGARDFVVEAFETLNGNIKDLPKASAPLEIAKKPFVEITNRGSEDTYEAGYNALLEKGIKSDAREKFLISKNSIFENLRSLSDQDYENYKESTEYQKVMKEHCPDLAGLTPSSSIVEAEIKIPALKMQKIDEAIDKANKQTEKLSSNQNDQSEVIKNGTKIISEIKNDIRNLSETVIEQNELNGLQRSEKEDQVKTAERESLSFEQKISALNGTADALNQIAFLTKNKSLRTISNSFNLVSNFATQSEKIIQRERRLQQLSQGLENPFSKLSNVGAYEITTLYLTMGLSFVNMFAQNEDPIFETLKEIMSQIYELGEMMRERFDIVDLKLNQIISQIKELRDLETKNSVVTRAQIKLTLDTLKKLEKEFYSFSYKRSKDISYQIDESLENAVTRFSKTPSDKGLFQSTLSDLSETATNFSKRSHRTFVPSNLLSTQEKIQELQTRNSSELGALIGSEIFDKDVENRAINKLTLNTKTWSDSSNLISSLIIKRNKFEKKPLEASTLETLQNVQDSAFSYTQTLAELIHRNPQSLLIQLEKYKKSIDSLINQFSENYKHEFVGTKKTVLRIDGSFQDLLERTENLPQPEWGKIISTWSAERSLFQNSDFYGNRYEAYSKIPDAVWKLLKPETKLASWIRKKPIRVICMMEAAYKISKNPSDFQKGINEFHASLEGKIVFDDLGNQIDLKIPSNFKNLGVWLLLREYPRIHWLFLTEVDGKEKVFEHIWGDFLITQDLQYSEKGFRNKEFIRKYIFELATYKQHDKHQNSFSYMESRLPFVASNEYYSESPPPLNSTFEINFEKHTNYINNAKGNNKYDLFSPNERLLWENPIWIMNERRVSLTETTKEWFQQTQLNSENAPLVNNRDEATLIKNFKESSDFNALLVIKGVDFLYPNLSPKEETIKDKLFSPPNFLYSGNDIETLFKKGFTEKQIKELTKKKIENIRNFLIYLSKKEYEAPLEITNILYELENLKNSQANSQTTQLWFSRIRRYSEELLFLINKRFP